MKVFLFVFFSSYLFSSHLVDAVLDLEILKSTDLELIDDHEVKHLIAMKVLFVVVHHISLSSMVDATS